MFLADPTADMLARGVILSMAGLIWVMILIRVNGLRSLSKMNSFDFVVTVAMGSLLAGAAQATGWRGFGQAMTAMAALLAMQYLLARLRKASGMMENVLQNDPVILMRNGLVDADALARTRVSRTDLIAKLREANVLDFANVRAVVLETTGDVSVLHGDRLDPALLEDARD